MLYDDETMSPIDVEVREPLTGAVVPVKVIGVLDRIHESFDDFAGMIVSKETLDDAVPFPVPITTYHFRMADGVDAELIEAYEDAGVTDLVLSCNTGEVGIISDTLAAFAARHIQP